MAGVGWNWYPASRPQRAATLAARLQHSLVHHPTEVGQGWELPSKVDVMGPSQRYLTS
jgi:hypothetical protein